MKGIILASAAVVIAFIVSVAVFRLGRIERRAYVLLWIFAICAALLAGASWATPDDLLVLPRTLLAEPRWLDLVSSLFFFAGAFFGGLLQLYNLADRGFSLRVLIDVLELDDKPASAAVLYEAYSGGKGLVWMYQKRINDMVHNRLVIEDGDALVATDAGRRTAMIFGRLRRIFGVELP